MRILITGANGLLGQKLIDQLSSWSDAVVVATGRGENRNPIGDYQYARMDITDNNEVQSVLDQYQPTHIINCAAMTHVDMCETHREECWDQNVNAVDYLIKGCQRIGAYLLHVSTDFIFDGMKDTPWTEEDTPNPISVYGKTKLVNKTIRTLSGRPAWRKCS